MITLYLRQAWAMMRHNRLFSSMYISLHLLLEIHHCFHLLKFRRWNLRGLDQMLTHILQATQTNFFS